LFYLESYAILAKNIKIDLQLDKEKGGSEGGREEERGGRGERGGEKERREVKGNIVKKHSVKKNIKIITIYSQR